MLKTISPLISPELLKVLAEMGHGDEIIFSDAHFPAHSMGPQVIAVDEIGTPEDVHAIEYAMHCGCKMLATVHAESMEELRKKPLFNRMIGEGRFERYILLGNNAHVGQIEGIFDNRGSLLYKEAMEMAK